MKNDECPRRASRVPAGRFFRVCRPHYRAWQHVRLGVSSIRGVYSCCPKASAFTAMPRAPVFPIDLWFWSRMVM